MVCITQPPFPGELGTSLALKELAPWSTKQNKTESNESVTRNPLMGWASVSQVPSLRTASTEGDSWCPWSLFPSRGGVVGRAAAGSTVNVTLRVDKPTGVREKGKGITVQ